MIKKNEQTGKFIVQYSERHPVTRKVKTLRRQANTEAQARRIFNELVTGVKASFATSGRKMNWPSLLDLHYQDLESRGYAKSTIENHKLCLDAHTRECWANRAIDTITPGEIRTLINDALSNKSRSHRKSILKFIRAAFNHAVDQRMIQVSPVPRMQFRLGKKFKKVLNEEQAAQLLQKAEEYEHEWWRHWAFQTYTGLRNEESYPMRKTNVNLATRQIFVVESWTKKGGLVDLTKTGEDRVVEIAPPLVPIIKYLLELQKDSIYLLPRIDDWDAGRQAEVLRTFLAGIGLPQISFHNLRATWATIMLSKGVPLAQVMKLGGWKSIKTLSEHYLRQTGIDIRGATDRMVLLTQPKP